MKNLLASDAKSQRGFSLIELMIAMTIGLGLVTSIGYVFLGAKATFNTMDALANIQETARYAFEYMSKDIRMAGYSGGPAEGASSIRFNAVQTPTAWDPNLKDLFETPLIGYKAGVSTFPTFPTTRPRLRGDAFTVVRADNDQEFSLSAHSEPVFTLSFTTCPTSGLPAAGQIYVASDYTHSAVFQIESASACGSGSMTVNYNSASGSASPGNIAPTQLGAFNGAIAARKLYPLKAATYYIANNDAGAPALYRLELTNSGTTAIVSAVEVIEGIRDMQVEYGVDTDTVKDDSLNDYWTAAAVTAGTNGTNSMPPALNTIAKRWQRVLSVRVSLTLESRQGTNVTTSGGLLTKTFANTIAVRNRLL